MTATGLAVEIAGWGGAVLILLAYLLLSGELSDRLRQDVQSMAANLSYTLQSGGRQDLLEQIGAMTASLRDGSSLAVFIDPQGESVAGNFRPDHPFAGHRALRVGRDMALIAFQGEVAPTDYYAYGLQTPQGWIIVARDAEWVAENTEVLSFTEREATALNTERVVRVAAAWSLDPTTLEGVALEAKGISGQLPHWKLH